MQKIKVFSTHEENELAANVNSWIREQGPMCVVDEWHFSTSHDTNNGYTIYSVMIVYRDL